MPDKPVRLLERPLHPSLVDLAYEALLKAIVDQQVAPGQLLNIDSLAGQLHMSKTPVREALMRLIGEGLVHQTNNRGFVVSPLLTETEFHQLFRARRLLEVHLLESARLDNAVIERLSQSVEHMARMAPGVTYDRYAEFNRADHEFHRALLSLSSNRFLLKAWSDLHFHLHIARLYTGVGIFDHAEAATEHAAILAALRAGRQTRAVTLLADHIDQAETRLIALYGDSA